MEIAAGRSMRAVATLTTVGALALTPIAVAPPELHAPSISARVSTQAVQLTDAWSNLAAGTVASVTELAVLALGTNGSFFPLPSPTNPLAPIATQLVLNQLIYAAQLFTGKGGQIPGEVSTHLTELYKVAAEAGNAIPDIVVQQIQTPFVAAADAINSINAGGKLLQGLFEAPAVFLNIALNSPTGLLGVYGPIGLPLIVRNLVTKALYTPPPTIVLPFKKASAAALTVPQTVASPSGTAGSARPKPKAPSAAAASAKKASAAKAGTARSGAGRGKR